MTTRRPLSLSDQQMRAVSTAAAGLPFWSRAQFLRIIADCLETVPHPGDLAVSRAIRTALSRCAGTVDHSNNDDGQAA
jgi:hypothetical protein